MDENGIFFVSLPCEFDANTFEGVLDLVTEVMFSSGFALVALCFIRSWASAFFKPIVNVRVGRFNPMLLDRKKRPRLFHVWW